MTAADVARLADQVRTEYLVRKRDTDPVAAALDVLERILIWAETPTSLPVFNEDAQGMATACREHVRTIAGQRS